MPGSRWPRFLLMVVMPFTHTALAEEIRVAVASNFAGAARALAEGFQAASGHEVTLASGSTGKHYAQIRKGAPFHVFLAADAERPRLLEQEGWTVADSRFTYALGKVALWSPREGFVDSEGAVLGATGRFDYLAIANPRLAPYGAAAAAVLQALGRYETVRDRLVRGENIGQTYQFVASGAAELGFVAYSQVLGPDGAVAGSAWLPPQELYPPIEQQAVRLRYGANSKAAADFMEFLAGPEGRSVVERFGYGTP